MAYGNIVYTRQIATLPSLIGRGLYVGGSLEAGRLWDTVSAADGSPLLNPEEMRYGGSLFFAADTFVGPFFTAFGLSGEGDSTIYVLLSQPWEL
jgi:NTE family protein